MCNLKPLAFILLATLSIVGCSPDAPTGKSSLENFPDELTKAEYDALTNEQKYAVSNKLMTTMFQGIPVADFYDLSQGMDNLALSSAGENLLSDTKNAVITPLSEKERVFNDMIITGYNDIGGDRSINSKFALFDNKGILVDDWPKQQPIARMMQYPLSKETFDYYVAYILVNTILFAPAEEIDSASILDVSKVFNKLYDDLRRNRTMSEIISRHQRTQENWRRFRSPEDNTREMIEIYLGLFDRDEDVPRASIACQNLFLTDADRNYELMDTGTINTVPQFVLDTFVTSCGDFYDVVANHPLVVPRMATVLTEYFFFSSTSEVRAAMVEKILSGGPTTFQDIVKTIIFSKEYLLNNERPKSFEESFFGMAHQTKWRPYKALLQDLTVDEEDSPNRQQKVSLRNMGWATMRLKLGRFTGVPLDALSFANYHRGLREAILVDGDNGASESCGNTRSESSNSQIASSDCEWREGLGLILPEEPLDPALREDENGDLLTSQPLEEELDKYAADLAEYNRRLEVYEQVQALSLDEYFDYLFMSIVSRKASDVEKADLIQLIREEKTGGSAYIREDINQNLFVFVNENSTNRSNRTFYDEVARVVFDYLSRLPETYYYHKIN